MDASNVGDELTGRLVGRGDMGLGVGHFGNWQLLFGSRYRMPPALGQGNTSAEHPPRVGLEVGGVISMDALGS